MIKGFAIEQVMSVSACGSSRFVEVWSFDQTSVDWFIELVMTEWGRSVKLPSRHQVTAGKILHEQYYLILLEASGYRDIVEGGVMNKLKEEEVK